MPIIWRFLLGQYLKGTALCISAFIAILLATQLQDIAHIAALGADLDQLFWFTLYQIPFILPLAIAIAGLISAAMLARQLSETRELTALRASGISLYHFLYPLFFGAIAISLLNFAIVSEIATSAHFFSNQIKTSLRTINPLLLLNSKNLMRQKGLYFESLGHSRRGESAENVLIAVPGQGTKRLQLVLAKELDVSSEEFKGKKVAILSSLEHREGYDPLIIEHLDEMKISTFDLSHLFHQQVWSVKNDHLRLSQLIEKRATIRKKEEGRACDLELLRRLSLGIAPFTLTFLGAAMSITTGRTRSYRCQLLLILLTGLFLVSYFAAKEASQYYLAIAAYSLPHPILIICSIYEIRRRTRGITG